MGKALWALGAGVVAVALAAGCGNVTTPAAAPTPTPTPTGTATPTPTGSATPTPTPGTGSGILRLDVKCSGVGCVSGDLYGQVVDCAAPTVVFQHDSSLNLTMAMNTTYPLWLEMVAPGLDCVHVFLDVNHDGVKNAGDKGTFLDPQTGVPVGASGTSSQIIFISQ